MDKQITREFSISDKIINTSSEHLQNANFVTDSVTYALNMVKPHKVRVKCVVTHAHFTDKETEALRR